MKYLLILFFTILPATAFAAAAGTDGYLRELGYSDAQLSTEVVTEDREAFSGAEGTGRVEDPFGDVLTRFGTTSKILQPWGDISEAILTKNDETQTWDFAVSFGGAIPDAPSYNAQLFVYVDADDDAANNARQGIRIGTDAEFSVQHDETNGWYVDFRWYNPDADFWAVNKDTGATFDVGANSITIHVPFSEAPATLAPHWRIAMGVADGANTQIDVAPGVGFPAPKGETYPTAQAGFVGSLPWLGALALVLAVAYGAKRTVAKKRRA